MNENLQLKAVSQSQHSFNQTEYTSCSSGVKFGVKVSLGDTAMAKSLSLHEALDQIFDNDTSEERGQEGTDS